MSMIREGKVPGWEVNFVQYKSRYLITPQLLPLAKKKREKSIPWVEKFDTSRHSSVVVVLVVAFAWFCLPHPLFGFSGFQSSSVVKDSFKLFCVVIIVKRKT